MQTIKSYHEDAGGHSTQTTTRGHEEVRLWSTFINEFTQRGYTRSKIQSKMKYSHGNARYIREKAGVKKPAATQHKQLYEVKFLEAKTRLSARLYTK